MITTSIRIQCESLEHAQAISIWLHAQLGSAITLTAPHAGRGAGVWFVRGTLRIDPTPTTTPEQIDRQFANVRRMVDAVIRTTGQVVQVPDPDDQAPVGAYAIRPRRKR